MRVHHLNCGSMSPPLVGRLEARVLLCETDDGLVLVDSGFGTRDLADPGRLGPARFLLGAALDPTETALAQVRLLGFDPADVAHIVLTHLDLDHVGGISDFPDALVHTTADEYRAAMVTPDRRERRRYRPQQWGHRPRLWTHKGPGEPWHGFPAAHSVVGDAIALVPMPGHSRGHAAVAVRSEDGLLVHAGDAVFDAASIGGTTPDGRPLAPRKGLRRFEQVVAHDRGVIAANHAQLRALRTDLDAFVFGAHDPRVF